MKKESKKGVLGLHARSVVMPARTREQERKTLASLNDKSPARREGGTGKKGLRQFLKG